MVPGRACRFYRGVAYGAGVIALYLLALEYYDSREVVWTWRSILSHSAVLYAKVD